MAAAATTTSTIPRPLAVRLRALRRRIALWFVVDGAAWTLLTMIVLAAFDLLIDRWFRLDLPQRRIMLVLMIAGLLAVAYWRLMRPLTASLSDDALCLEVERRHRQLGQSVISAVQFARMGDNVPVGVSRSMLQATIAQGTRAAQQVSFNDVLNGRRFWFNLAMAAIGALLVALGGLAVAITDGGAVWFNRNILLGDRLWPQKTYLDVKRLHDGKVVFPRGEDWIQQVEVSRQSRYVPSELEFRFRGGPFRASQKVQSKRSTPRLFELQLTNVYQEFEFRVHGGDATTPWIAVELVDKPVVTDLNLEVTPPEYVGEGPRLLPQDEGPYSVLKGSSLRLSGISSKSLARADLHIGSAALPLTINNGAEFSITLSPGQLTTAAYAIQLQDTAGLTSNRRDPFLLQIRSDGPPLVRAKLVGVGGMVVPQAEIPISGAVSDEFSITDVRLSYHWHGDGNSANGDDGVVRFKSLSSRLGAASVEFDEVWQLSRIDVPAGSVLLFQIEADDNDNVSGPNSGHSAEFLLRVVSQEQLRTDLLRREKEQRQEFKQLVENQLDLLTDTRALAATIAEDESLPADDKQAAMKRHRQQLMELQRNQKLIGTNTATIARRLQSLLFEVRNNHLEEEGGPLQRRLGSQIVVPMQQLAERAMPAALRQLDKTRRLFDQAATRKAAFDEAAQQQAALVEAMEEILNQMVKSEDYQEAVNLLYQIEKLQKGVFDQTRQQLQERIRRLLEQSGEQIDENRPGDNSGDENSDDN